MDSSIPALFDRHDSNCEFYGKTTSEQNQMRHLVHLKVVVLVFFFFFKFSQLLLHGQWTHKLLTLKLERQGQAVLAVPVPARGRCVHRYFFSITSQWNIGQILKLKEQRVILCIKVFFTNPVLMMTVWGDEKHFAPCAGEQKPGQLHSLLDL